MVQIGSYTTVLGVPVRYMCMYNVHVHVALCNACGAACGMTTSLLLGHPVPTGSPMGLPTFFFFFRRDVLCPFVVKKTMDWAEILQNHTYGHASG